MQSFSILSVKTSALLDVFQKDSRSELILNRLETIIGSRIQLKGLNGSSRSVLVAALFEQLNSNHLIILPDKEIAAYFLNDLEGILRKKDLTTTKKGAVYPHLTKSL